jgi:hypothetical protein
MKPYIFLVLFMIALLEVFTGCAGPGNSYDEYKNEREGKRAGRDRRERDDYYNRARPYSGYYSPYYRR